MENMLLNRVLHAALNFELIMIKRADDDKPYYRVKITRQKDGREVGFSMHSSSCDEILEMAKRFLDGE